jgi:two-component system, NarL family, sensor histidine kinase DevS
MRRRAIGSTSTRYGCGPMGDVEVTLLVQAVELAPDGVLIVDKRGTIVYANRSMCALAGVDDLVNMSVESLVPQPTRDRHAQLREGYARHPQARPMGAGLDLALEHANGTMIPVEISLSPLTHGGRFVIAAVRDVTDRLDSQRRLNAAHEQLALVSERERIGRDLHDVVLQHLYGMGLSAQAIATSADPATAAKLEAVVEEVDHIISEVRTIVFTLGPGGRRGALGQELTDVVAQASRVLGFTPGLRIEGPVETLLSDDIRTEMVASMREALGNVARHARASHASVVIGIVDDQVVMTVVDNGVGPPDDETVLHGGHGLNNLMSRAAAFGGTCTLTRRDPSDGSGAILRWAAPY